LERAATWRAPFLIAAETSISVHVLGRGTGGAECHDVSAGFPRRKASEIVSWSAFRRPDSVRVLAKRALQGRVNTWCACPPRVVMRARFCHERTRRFLDVRLLSVRFVHVIDDVAGRESRHRVVDLPEPVGPVTSRCRVRSPKLLEDSGAFDCSKDGILVGIRGNAAAGRSRSCMHDTEAGRPRRKARRSRVLFSASIRSAFRVHDSRRSCLLRCRRKDRRFLMPQPPSIRTLGSCRPPDAGLRLCSVRESQKFGEVHEAAPLGSRAEWPCSRKVC